MVGVVGAGAVAVAVTAGVGMGVTAHVQSRYLKVRRRRIVASVSHFLDNRSADGTKHGVCDEVMSRIELTCA